jgi:benzaldehyde dehydrogenase (NAD)
MSTERIVAERPVADELATKLAERARNLVTGDPTDPGTQIGALVDENALSRIGELVEDAKSKGADVLAGGEAQGACFQPTVLAGVTPDMRIYGEESFGPVVSVVAEYGLSAAVFSRDVPRALSVARRIRSGICHVNSSTVQDEAQMPFGGVGDSGYGRFGARAALDEFTELRWVSVQEGSRHYPI